MLEVEPPCLSNLYTPVSTPLVQDDESAGVECGCTRLESLAGRVREVGAIGDPLEYEQLSVVEAEIHVSSLSRTADTWAIDECANARPRWPEVALGRLFMLGARGEVLPYRLAVPPHLPGDGLVAEALGVELPPLSDFGVRGDGDA